MEAAFAALDPTVDLILLAGDLTTHGEPAQAAVLAELCREIPQPVLAVLGNHDWHANRTAAVIEALQEGGIEVLDRSEAIVESRGLRVGVAGTKGFVGGFPDSSLPDFGEPSLRRACAETTREVAALERSLRRIENCDIRIVLLHYAPTTTTLGREVQGIWAFLGSDRLPRPILDHTPDLVLHGHAHAGSFKGFVGSIPVYNVAVQVTGEDFRVFEVGGGRTGARSEGPVEARAE